MTAASSRRTLSIFVIANILAGFFNYLYQVLASKELSRQDFSDLNAWFANLAIFFFIGGLLQYAANFFPASQQRLRQAIVAVNLLAVALLAAWILGPPGQTLARAVLILIGAAVFGWLIGQAQSRLLFHVMTVAGLIVGVFKVALIFVDTNGTLALERYSFALFACYLPALWWMSQRMWSEPTPNVAKKNLFSLKLWSAPILLSLAAAVIPQMDMVLMNRIQPAEDFQEFARASLFYKGIYFVMFIVAQWLLPQQIRENQKRAPGSALGFASASLFASAAIAGLAPAVSQYFLQWDHSPPQSLIFLSCLNMSLLTWIFFEIQAHCSRHTIKPAAIALIVLGAEAILQLALGLSSNGYLIAAGAVQAILIVFLTRA